MNMDESAKQVILERAKSWFKEEIIVNHKKNIRKLKKSKELDINPFLVSYLSSFFPGEKKSRAVAKALLYPRVLGTSIVTSLGGRMQNFASAVLGSTFPSLISGLDIEFVDQVDEIRKYCQLKLGPNTLNTGDVQTIHGHFSTAVRLARTNNLRIPSTDFVVGVLFGETQDVNGSYKQLQNEFHYTLLVGKDFWHHLTGDEQFFYELFGVIRLSAQEDEVAQILEETIEALSREPEIQKF